MSDKEEKIAMKNAETTKGVGQKIKCGVTDCMHNCIDDSTCRLECIQVNVMSDKSHAGCKDNTACKSYTYGGDLNVSEMTGRD